ncbi:ArsR/SmtB family transcription factor [Candidatus Latescibacterota bacterium]
MDNKSWARRNIRANIIKALSHPSRLFIVEELNKGEQCVCKLTEMIGADTSTVSRHLSVLKNAGIVMDDKRGNQVFYSLKAPCVLSFLDCITRIIDVNIREQVLICTSGEVPVASGERHE